MEREDRDNDVGAGSSAGSREATRALCVHSLRATIVAPQALKLYDCRNVFRFRRRAPPFVAQGKASVRTLTRPEREVLQAQASNQLCMQPQPRSRQLELAA